ncbi:lymphocyte antigen 6E-like [Ambystoma mexicanum]|uniref:lymphocyte antigen 6E-like n=1 Tax=Ambystoma mexicanum TaxID=8296 RepID=UPI0037E977BF
MKTLLLTLVGAALCVGLADSRACYSCTAAMSDMSCKTIKNCSSNEDYCSTTVGSFLSLTWVTKDCASSCINGHQNLMIANATEGCCDRDLCNDWLLGDANSGFPFSGATSMKINALVPLALVAFLAALLKMGQ